MEKLSLDSDSPIRGDFRRDTDTHTPVRQTEREEAREMGEVCVRGGVYYIKSTVSNGMKEIHPLNMKLKAQASTSKEKSNC